MFLLLAGVGVTGTVIYQNFLPDSAAAAEAEKATQELYQEWAADDPSTIDSDITQVGMNRPLGKGFAVLYIPRLGERWRAVIVEGVSDDDLVGKIGHFRGSSDPGMVGNFAMAAHRLTDGSLFRYIDEVKEGDSIIVETRTHWYVYTMTSSKVINADDLEVIEPVPFKPGKKATKAIITLTTCYPWYSSSQRLAVFGELTEVRLKLQGPPESLPAANFPA